jgi:hypothetical protein
VVILSIITQEMYCALLQRELLATYPHTGTRNHGFHNKSYIEEPHTNEPGPEYNRAYQHVESGPFSYTRDDLMMSSTPPPQPLTNRGPASSVAVPGTNLHNAATQPYLELLHPQHRYHQPSAPIDNYEWQALNRMPVPHDLIRNNGNYEQIRAPHISRTDYGWSSQPSIRNRPAASIAFPIVQLHSPAPETDAKYLEPRRGLHSSFSSADNYKLPPQRRLFVPHDVRGNNEPDGQTKAPHLHRKESERAAYRPPASTTNLPR